jgi:predicted dehydrogenase
LKEPEPPVDRVKTALIGCGKVGSIHAQALCELLESELVGVCDASLDRASSFASKYGGRPFTNISTMLATSGAEAVTICTPHPLHASATMEAAQAGVHVMVEKPMAASLRDCDAMLAATKAAGVKLSVISQRRWLEPVQRVKAAIDAGKIGKPILGVFQMYSWRDLAYYQSDPWRGKWSTEGGGVLVNQSPHQLDLLRWFLGDVESISGEWGNMNHPGVEVDDTSVAILRFKSGALGSIITSVSQNPGLYTKVHVHGSNGYSVGVETDRGATFIAGVSGVAAPPMNDLWTVAGEESSLDVFQSEDRQRFAEVDATTHYHKLQIQDFLKAICEDRPPLVSGEDGREVVAMFTGIYRSAKERKAILYPLTAD